LEDINSQVFKARGHQTNITLTTVPPSKEGGNSCLFIRYLRRVGVVAKAISCFTIY